MHSNVKDSKTWIEEAGRRFTCMLCCRTIGSLCDDIDFFVSPHIEERMEFSLICYVVLPLSRIALLVESYADETQSIIGETGLKVLHQLNRTLHSVCLYNKEEGFSKKQPWLDFVDYINTVNVPLRDAVKKYQTITSDSLEFRDRILGKEADI